MGAGKSTLARLLGKTLAVRCSDLDARIVEREERSIAALFAESEARFRAAEASAVQGWLNRPPSAPAEILALGGGTLQNAEVAAALRERATIVALTGSPEQLIARLSATELSSRPLLAAAPDPVAALAELIERRRAADSRAHLTVSTDQLTAAEVQVAVLRALYHPSDGPWAEPARALLPGNSTAAGVTTGRGAIPFAPATGLVLLRDANLPPVQTSALIEIAKLRCSGRILDLPIPGGEASKQADRLLELWRTMLSAGVDRDWQLWIAGGGTLTDLGGLLGHGFKRGLATSLLPTTLLAQLDAALGGKNGINLDGAKNVLGTTRLPQAVQIDPLFLLSLPDVELRGALAEAVKSAVIGDPALLVFIERHVEEIGARVLPVLEEIAARSAAVKLAIVARDLEERDERRQLNFGHTLGHALEASLAQQKRPISHGDAVAIGMVFATYLSARAGKLEENSLLDRLPGILKRLGLPTAPPPMTHEEREQTLRALRHDKKRAGGSNVWVLPRATGRLTCEPVASSDVASALEFFT